jgi:hypothetical protein
MKQRSPLSALCIAALVTCSTSPLTTQAKPADDKELARAAQNPIADMISVPLQSSINNGVGPDEKTQYINLIQPVIPQSIGDDWNWIHRGIIPAPMYQPGVSGVPSMDNTWGVGDIQYQGFLTPAKPGKWIWGVGPYLSFPTASDDLLGTEKWSAGPGIVVLTFDGPWVFGGLFTQLWSYAGNSDREDVNQSSFQYFLNYNIPDGKGWYLTSSPTMTADWKADSSQQFTVPMGGGIGRVFHVGKQAINAKVQAFGYPVAPDNGPSWSLQFQLTFLFPR